MPTDGLDRVLNDIVGTAQPGAGRRSLRVLLTNDDGWSATGITSVRRALTAAGHRVTIVAPAANQSGSSARAAFGGQLTVTRHAEDVYAVDGSPSEAAAFGAHVVFAEDPPDVVVSGANSGQNVGAIVVHSGTVGAVVAALLDGIPAIALSTEIDLATAATPHDAAAGFLVELLDGLMERRSDALLPEGIGLNVNHPYVEDGSSPSAVRSRTGRGFIDLHYSGAELPTVDGDAATFQVGVTLDVPEPRSDADTTALADNRITISVIEADFDL